jgi:hypothetical protein
MFRHLQSYKNNPELRQKYDWIEKHAYSNTVSTVFSTVCSFPSVIIPELEKMIETEKSSRQKKEVLLESETKKSHDLITTLEKEKYATNLLMTSIKDKDTLHKVELKAMEKSNEEQKIEIIKLKENISHQIQKNTELDLKLSLSEKMNEQLERNNAQLKTEITLQTQASQIKIKTLEDEMAFHKKTFDDFKTEMNVNVLSYQESQERLLEAKRNIEDLQNEILNLQQQHDAESILLSDTLTTQSQPLSKQLNEAKKLNEGLLLQLADENQNINGLSFIRWCDDPRLNEEKMQNDLLARGAILSVEDLHKRVKEIKPPHKEPHTINRLIRAITKLLSDYHEKILPLLAQESLVNVMIDKIAKDFKAENPQGLQDIYSIKIDLMKSSFLDKYFSNECQDIPILDKQFKKAVKWILKSEKHKHYRKFLADENLINKLRVDNSDPLFTMALVNVIKSKMHASQIKLSKVHRHQVLQSILQNATPELNQWIHDKVIHYWASLRDELNPLKAENAYLKLQLSELGKNFSSQPLSPKLMHSKVLLFSHSEPIKNIQPLLKENHMRLMG